MLAPTLEAAIAVARAGLETTPPLPVPRPLRPVVRMARLPSTALAAARKALEDDEDFRERVALFVDDELIGKAGVLFLTRPDGWQEELAALTAAAEADASAGEAEKEERSARRKLKGAEEAIRRAELARDAARSEADRATADLAEERRNRRASEDREARLRSRVAALEQERDAARRKLQHAESHAAELDAALSALRSSVGSAHEEHASAQDQAERLQRELAEAQARAARAEREARSRAGAAAQAVAEAASAASDLASALDRVAAALGQSSDAVAVSQDVDRTVTSDAPLEPVRSPRRDRSPSGPSRRGPNRQPLPLPFAVFDDSPEAAEHLLRANGVVLLVDGYNATISAWPELTISEQRRRLVDALGELAVRTGADVHVIFDGSEDGGVMRADAGVRRLVRVSFTAGDVEADDVMLDLVDALPTHRPVVVASDDRRVRDGAVARGANLLSGAQLFSAMRRER